MQKCRKCKSSDINDNELFVHLQLCSKCLNRWLFFTSRLGEQLLKVEMFCGNYEVLEFSKSIDIEDYFSIEFFFLLKHDIKNRPNLYL